MPTTEVESHKKWCPFVRVDGNNRLNNQLTDGFESTPEPYHCIGSKCMMWRDIHNRNMKAGYAAGHQAHGYCALGGQPDI